MKTLHKTFYAKPLAAYLAAALLAITTFAGPAEAMLVPAADHGNTAASLASAVDRAAGMTRIQTALESKVVRQKLMDYGLSPEETMARVSKLSDEQINTFATNTDALQAGGDGGSLIVGLLVVAILVVVLVYLLEGRIEVH